MPWQNVGSPFIVISPANGIFLVYETPGPSLGTLIASISPTGGTDQYGNTYLAGIVAYVVITTFSVPQTYAIQLGVAPSSAISQGAGMLVQSLTDPPGAPGGVFGLVSSIEALVFLSSGEETGSDVAANIQVSSAAASNPTSLPDGYISLGASLTEVLGWLQIDTGIADNQYQTGSGAVMTLGPNAASPNNPGVINPNDKQIYSLGKQWGPTASDITLGTSATVVCAVNVVTGMSYRFRVFLALTEQQAAGTFSIGFDGSASASGVAHFGVGQSGTAPNWNINTNGMPTLITSATMTGAAAWYEAEGQFTCSVSGVLNVRGQISTAGDTAKVIHGSYMWVEPIQ
jgi:hypothetical protein